MTPGGFKVDCPGAVLRSIEILQGKAEKAGLGPATLAALKTISQRLHQDPREFGEPQYHLHFLKLQMRVACVEPLSVLFAVHDEEPFVHVKSITALSRFNI